MPATKLLSVLNMLELPTQAFGYNAGRRPQQIRPDISEPFQRRLALALKHQPVVPHRPGARPASADSTPQQFSKRPARLHHSGRY